MNVSIDITKKFNTQINYDYFLDTSPMNPIIFLNFPSDIKGCYEFEVMNFGLNLSEEMNEIFNKYHPYFEDITKCTYEFRRLLIFGKARFKIQGVKGADIKFADKDNPLSGDRFFHSWPYKIEKGDYIFTVGGYSSFSPHFITMNIIGTHTCSATISFSSDDYVLISSDENGCEEFAASKQTKYLYTNIVGKTFDDKLNDKYFQLVYGKDVHTRMAIESERE